MKKRDRISVVIPNWNGEKIIGSCISSLQNQTFPPYEIIVVDNASTDLSKKIIRKIHPNINLIELKKNLGFAGAVNRGIKVAKGNYILIFNNDARADSNLLKVLIHTIKEKKVGAVTPRVIRDKYPRSMESAGDFINIVGQAFHRGYGDSINRWNKKEEVFLVPATAALFAKSVFHDVGLFDESFFAYGEDVDWCLRAQILGYRFFYEPKGIVYHKHKYTGKRNPRLLEYLQFRNMILCIIKNFPISLFFKRWRFLLIPLTYLHTFLFLSKKGYSNEATKAILWLIRNYSDIIEKRREIQSNRKTSIEYLDRQMTNKKIRLFQLKKE
jgi:GT2 family glycosyltransferase